MKASLVDGRSCIGDTGKTDDVGHPHTADCKKDTTSALGPNAHLNEAEDATVMYLGASEAVVAGALDDKLGEVAKAATAKKDLNSLVEDTKVSRCKESIGHK